MNAIKNALDKESWRLSISTFGYVVSEGRWIPHKWNRYVLAIVQEAIAKGGARLIINAPPQHGKSEMLSHWLPTWYLDMNPTKKVILASYGDDFARDWGYKVRNEFINNDYTWTTVSKEQHRSNNWSTAEGGSMRSVGIGGALTGRGGDLIIIDDPHKDWAEALSSTYRQRVIDWFKATLYTRAQANASIIVVQTRWHENDLTGYLLNEHSDNWNLLRLPAIAEQNDPLARTEGESLCEDRFPQERLLQAKKSLGSHMFAGLYQQRPAPLEGGMVQRAWFNRFDLHTFNSVRLDATNWLQSWDLTFKATGTSYVVGQIWAKLGSNYYLMDQFRNKIDFPDTLKEINKLAIKWPKAVTKLVEDKANGPAVISTLKDSVGGIIAYSPRGSKEARLASVSGLIEAGNVYIPDDTVYSWGDDMIEEIVTFPSSANDDQVDAMTMALDRFSSNTNITDFSLPSAGVKSSEWSILYG